MRSVNQNHHLYVIKGGVNQVSKTSTIGTIYPYMTADDGAVNNKDLYFKYMGRDKVITRSDMIPLNQITYAKWVTAAAMETPLKKVTVKLDEDIHKDSESNTIKPIPGQDYILNIAFQQFYGLSPEDTYVKTIAVHATSKMDTAKKFYDALVEELKASFAREVGADAEENPYLDFESTNNGVIITEKEQAWSLGKWEMESLVFDVFPSTIYVDGVEMEWGTADNDVSDQTVPNGKRMADLEWFTFGERGDIYRGMGYPNNFDFVPLVDPEQAYDALEIHFAYQGSCEDIQKSEKDITIIGTNAQISTLVGLLQGENYINATIKKIDKTSSEEAGNGE